MYFHITFIILDKNMFLIKSNFYSIYRVERLLSLYQKHTVKYSIASSVKLNSTIQKLINSKQYKEALDLFDQKFETCTDYTINMAIKACTALNDHTRGINIQQKLSSNSLNNSYIQTSLIQFYSESFILSIRI